MCEKKKKSVFVLFFFFFFNSDSVCVFILELVANRMLRVIRVCVSRFASVCAFLRLSIEKSLSFIKLLLSITLEASGTGAVEIQGGM